MRKKNQLEFHVYGRNALFSDPITRAGGEKFSYQIPTYQALKGIIESVYWKPTFIWVIDSVRVMHAIRTEAKNVRPIAYYDDGNTLSIYTYLVEPSYHVRAHFIWNETRPELTDDRNENKHYFIAKRMLERGGRRDVFLGTRECQGYVEPCTFDEGEGYYDHYGDLDMGLMLHGFDYPDETGENQLGIRLWRPIMKNGCVDFILPGECKYRRILHPMKAKAFGEDNFSGLSEPDILDMLTKGGAEFELS